MEGLRKKMRRTSELRFCEEPVFSVPGAARVRDANPASTVLKVISTRLGEEEQAERACNSTCGGSCQWENDAIEQRP